MKHTYSQISSNNLPPLKNLDKPYDTEDGGDATKGDIVDYYIRVAPYLLPHIIDKPFSMIHTPDGVRGGKVFYQKERPNNAPEQLKSVTIPSSKRGVINWCLVNDTTALVYMVSRSVIEMHTWFSRYPDLDKPDIAVIDLDPSGESGFAEAKVVAKTFGTLLAQLNIYGIPKTSGGKGMHICIPINPTPYPQVQDFLHTLCHIVASTLPDITTLERSIQKRGSKVYLDAVQFGQGKTIAASYSLRAKKGLPVSTPLFWNELDNISNPTKLNLYNIFDRLSKVGDPMTDFYNKAQKLPKL